MLVEISKFDKILERLKLEPVLSLDTETTGLRPYHGDELFCLILNNGYESFYFNFAPDAPECLTKIYLALLQTELFSDASKTFILHNAKFDQAILANAGCYLAGTIHCTKAVARVLQNDRLSLSLAACAHDLGLEKSEAVEDYITQHKLFDQVKVPGKDKRIKLKHFDKVPFEIMQPYAEKDAQITFDLYRHQFLSISNTALQTNLAPGWVPLVAVMKNERALTRVLFDMD